MLVVVLPSACSSRPIAALPDDEGGFEGSVDGTVESPDGGVADLEGGDEAAATLGKDGGDGGDDADSSEGSNSDGDGASDADTDAADF